MIVNELIEILKDFPGDMKVKLLHENDDFTNAFETEATHVSCVISSEDENYVVIE